MTNSNGWATKFLTLFINELQYTNSFWAHVLSNALLPTRPWEMSAPASYAKLREIFLWTARAHETDFFWRHVKSCNSLGKINNSSRPWPCYNQSIATLSANRTNTLFIDAVAKLSNSCSISTNVLISNSTVETNDLFTLKLVSLSNTICHHLFT